LAVVSCPRECDLFRNLGAEKLLVVPAHHFLAAPAKQTFGAGVPREEDVVEIRDDDGFARLVHHLGKIVDASLGECAVSPLISFPQWHGGPR